MEESISTIVSLYFHYSTADNEQNDVYITHKSDNFTLMEAKDLVRRRYFSASIPSKQFNALCDKLQTITESWETSYESPTNKETNWDVIIQFSDGSKKIFYGAHRYPKNWRRFLRLMKRYVML